MDIFECGFTQLPSRIFLYSSVSIKVFYPIIMNFNNIIFISTMDPSGDKIGAELVKHFSKKNPDVRFYGIGGKYMANAGVKLLYDASLHGVMGPWEVIKKIFVYISIINKIKKFINTHVPDSVICIGSWGLNNRLMKMIKKNALNTAIICMSPPEIWAWRRVFWKFMNRIRPIIKYADIIIFNYPFEEKIYLDAIPTTNNKKMFFD